MGHLRSAHLSCLLVPLLEREKKKKKRCEQSVGEECVSVQWQRLAGSLRVRTRAAVGGARVLPLGCI